MDLLHQTDTISSSLRPILYDIFLILLTVALGEQSYAKFSPVHNFSSKFKTFKSVWKKDQDKGELH